MSRLATSSLHRRQPRSRSVREPLGHATAHPAAAALAVAVLAVAVLAVAVLVAPVKVTARSPGSRPVQVRRVPDRDSRARDGPARDNRISGSTLQAVAVVAGPQARPRANEPGSRTQADPMT